MPIPVVQGDRAPIHASLDDMHRDAGQFQTRLTRHGRALLLKKKTSA